MSTELLLSAPRVVTDPERPVIEDGAVLVRDGTIAAVGREADAPAAADHRHFPGATILPGLINTHVHLCFDVTRDPVPALERGEPAGLAAVVATHARALLDEGVTTARDLGDRDGVVDAFRRTARGPVPRLLTAFAPLTSPGGHCWFLGGEVAGASAIADAVADRAARGADWIKVMAGGGAMTPAGAAMWESQFDQDELDLVVAGARAAGLPVAAHAHGTTTMDRCARAGVDTIEHASWRTAPTAGEERAVEPRDDVAERIAAAGIAVVPTRARGWWTWPPEAGLEALLERLAWMRGHGIEVVVGTDGGVGQGFFDDVVETLTLYEAAGWTRAQVIAMATTAAARVLRLEARTGRIATGHDADLLVVGGDPLADLTALRDVRLVVAGGRVHRPTPASTAGSSTTGEGPGR